MDDEDDFDDEEDPLERETQLIFSLLDVCILC
jgi:hypothetical protein